MPACHECHKVQRVQCLTIDVAVQKATSSSSHHFASSDAITYEHLLAAVATTWKRIGSVAAVNICLSRLLQRLELLKTAMTMTARLTVPHLTLDENISMIEYYYMFNVERSRCIKATLANFIGNPKIC